MNNIKPIVLRLPWAPSANEIWRNLRGSYRPYMAPKYRAFIKNVCALYVAQGAPRFEDKSPLQVCIRLFPPHKSFYDIDNRIKPTLDSLTKCGLWLDDRYVRKLSVEPGVPVKNGAIIVEIEEFDEAKSKEHIDTLLSWYGLEKLEYKSKKRK